MLISNMKSVLKIQIFNTSNAFLSSENLKMPKTGIEFMKFEK